MSRDRAGLTPLQLRIRAAATAAGKDLRSIAQEISVSEQTLKIMGGDRSRTPNADRMLAIAEVTGAPIEWFADGWDAVVPRSHIPADLGESGERIDELVALARDLSRRQEAAESRDEERERTVARLDERLRALERGGGPRPRAGRSPRN